MNKIIFVHIILDRRTDRNDCQSILTLDCWEPSISQNVNLAMYCTQGWKIKSVTPNNNNIFCVVLEK